MEQRTKKKLSLLPILVLVTLLALPIPAAALGLNVDLGQTYKWNLMNISVVDAIDLWDPSITRSRVLSTAGDGSDIQTLHTPAFRFLTRNFSRTSGTSGTVTLTVTGLNPSTVDWSANPPFTFYTEPAVPTIREQIPGRIGNPMVHKYNESWQSDMTDMRGAFLASDGIDMYKSGGILNINTIDYIYTNLGSFAAADYNPANYSYTLDRNKLALNDFTSAASWSAMLGDAHPEMRAGTGKYFLSTVGHDELAQTTHVYSVYPVIALKAPTPLSWHNASGGYLADEYTYFKGSGQAINLYFNESSTNPDLSRIRNITYLVINRTASYDIRMDIDTVRLAHNADTKWQNSLSAGHTVDFLYQGLGNDANLPFAYTLTAVNVPVPAPSTAWSTIAITPGYGISGHARAATVTVPAGAFESLRTGSYDIYLMGTTANNDVVALDQRTVRVVSSYEAGTDIGVFRSGQWILDYGIDRVVDRRFQYGLPTDKPVVGDFNNDGITDIGVFRSGQWILDYGMDRVVDRRLQYGLPTDKPVVGDFNNDGITDIGAFRYGEWILDYGMDRVVDRRLRYGMANDIPLVADFNNDGTTDIGVFRNGHGIQWILDYSMDTVVDLRFHYGTLDDKPVVGDFNNDGITDIGVVRSGKWILDYGMNIVVDRRFQYGLPTDIPLVGDFNNDR